MLRSKTPFKHYVLSAAPWHRTWKINLIHIYPSTCGQLPTTTNNTEHTFNYTRSMGFWDFVFWGQHMQFSYRFLNATQVDTPTQVHGLCIWSNHTTLHTCDRYVFMLSGLETETKSRKSHLNEGILELTWNQCHDYGSSGGPASPALQWGIPNLRWAEVQDERPSKSICLIQLLYIDFTRIFWTSLLSIR